MALGERAPERDLLQLRIQLEALLVERDPKDKRQLSDLHAAWAEAYLSTPHGSPVAIKIKK